MSSLQAFTNTPCRLNGSATGACQVHMGPSAIWRESNTCNSVLPARKLMLGPSIQPSISELRTPDERHDGGGHSLTHHRQDGSGLREIAAREGQGCHRQRDEDPNTDRNVVHGY